MKITLKNIPRTLAYKYLEGSKFAGLFYTGFSLVWITIGLIMLYYFFYYSFIWFVWPWFK